MNTTTASCGHLVAAIGAPGSPARLDRESRPCIPCALTESGNKECIDRLDFTYRDGITTRYMPGEGWLAWRTRARQRGCGKGADEGSAIADLKFLEGDHNV